MQAENSKNPVEAMNPIKSVVVLTTGGTIDKSYDESEGALSNYGSVVADKINRFLRLPYVSLDVKSIMAKDSLNMVESDREIVFQHLKEQCGSGNPVVVLHGTDTMTLTADYCFQRMPEPNIPIVFTGAMKPVGFVDSDGIQNVTEAICLAQVVSPGFYISFHGRLYRVPWVRKNKASKTFEKIAPSL